MTEFKKPPTIKHLVEKGYGQDYNETEELAEAYRELKANDPGGYYLLADFDAQQARRDWVHEQRTGTGLDDQTYTTTTPLSHYFSRDDVGQQQLAIAELLVAGYEQQEIAELIDLSTSTVQRIVDRIRVIMAGKASDDRA